MGSPHAICQSILLTFAGLRDSAINNPLDSAARDFMQLALQELEHSRGQCFQDIAALYFSKRSGQASLSKWEQETANCYPTRSCLKNTLDGRAFCSSQTAGSMNRSANFALQSLTNGPFIPVTTGCFSFWRSRAGELSTLSEFRREDGRFRFGSMREVKTTSLNTAFSLHNAPREIDYISIDTEGSELEVLQGLDFNKYKVGFLTIEHNFVPGKKEAFAEYLAPFGFKPVLTEFSNQDIWLVNEKR